jgi:acetylornithine deacetylase
MNLELFLDILNIESTSGSEGLLAEVLASRLATPNCRVSTFDVACPDVPAGTKPVKNVLLSWGNPEVVFCSHLDTVPPYIPPTLGTDDSGAEVIRGRGSCDAKGQFFSMYEACLKLEAEGNTNFGLLLLAGEETGSYGAKSFRDIHPGAKFVIVGEPTDNKMVAASKGTKSFTIKVKGKSFHSGYPQYGKSAVNTFVDLINVLNEIKFPEDSILGPTTWNVGKLISDNPQNILSNQLTCRIYFRTTFASDKMVTEVMDGFNSEWVEVTPHGGDTPSHYLTLDGFETTTVAFGSDAPQLSNFQHKILCGPGSILVAHTPLEFIKLADIDIAIENYVKMFHLLIK